MAKKYNPFTLAGKTPDEYIGTRVRLIRDLRGMSRAALAKRVNVTTQQIQKYETGSDRISSYKLFEISQALDVDIEVFFEGLAEGRKRVKKPKLKLEYESITYAILHLLQCINAPTDRSIS